jgi:hypothetical protein
VARGRVAQRQVDAVGGELVGGGGRADRVEVTEVDVVGAAAVGQDQVGVVRVGDVGERQGVGAGAGAVEDGPRPRVADHRRGQAGDTGVSVGGDRDGAGAGGGVPAVVEGQVVRASRGGQGDRRGEGL